MILLEELRINNIILEALYLKILVTQGLTSLRDSSFPRLSHRAISPISTSFRLMRKWRAVCFCPLRRLHHRFFSEQTVWHLTPQRLVLLLWEPGEITTPSDIRNFGWVGGRDFYFSFIVTSCSMERNKCQSDWSVSKPLLVLVPGGQDPIGGGQFLPVSGLCGKPISAGSGFPGCPPGAVFFIPSLYAARWVS